MVILEAGPFWHPDEDWVSDEAGSHPLYWTQKRIIGGADPIELGKNNSGRGVGGSMVHYAGYTPRFHPSDLSTFTDDGVGADWPIGYEDLRPHYEQVEAELPVAGQDWPWGYPHRYPFSPHPVSGAADKLREGALRCGIEMRVGPVGIVNGTFGNRPHCIYRGYCLQGCKVNAKASPYVTHLPDALAHGVEVRARLHGAAGGYRAGLRASPRRGLRHRVRRRTPPAARRGTSRSPATRSRPRGCCWPRPAAGSRTGWATTPIRSAATSWCKAPPSPPGGGPDELRMYKAPPPEISSEQFYETDPDRGFARGFSIQTVSPLPIGWAEHVLADGHWGAALREYMRDYNHWATIGVLNELLPHPDNRITLADETDPYGQPIARMDYTLCDNDKANMAYSNKVITDILHAADAQDMLTIQRFAHLIGGARMGSSPEHSVVDANQRAWAVPNLFLADGSVCPTQGAANPALTIMALASRLAQRMASGAAMADDPATRAGRTRSVAGSQR